MSLSGWLNHYGTQATAPALLAMHTEMRALADRQRVVQVFRPSGWCGVPTRAAVHYEMAAQPTLLAMDSCAKFSKPSSAAFSCRSARIFSMIGALSTSPAVKDSLYSKSLQLTNATKMPLRHHVNLPTAETHGLTHLHRGNAPEDARVRKARYISSLNALHEGSHSSIGTRNPASCSVFVCIDRTAHGWSRHADGTCPTESLHA